VRFIKKVEYGEGKEAGKFIFSVGGWIFHASHGRKPAVNEELTAGFKYSRSKFLELKGDEITCFSNTRSLRDECIELTAWSSLSCAPSKKIQLIDLDPSSSFICWPTSFLRFDCHSP
jgi:hypothetical protein